MTLWSVRGHAGSHRREAANPSFPGSNPGGTSKQQSPEQSGLFLFQVRARGHPYRRCDTVVDMRRIALLMLAVTVAMTALTACGDDTSVSPPADLSTPKAPADMTQYPHDCGCICAGTCID